MLDSVSTLGLLAQTLSPTSRLDPQAGFVSVIAVGVLFTGALLAIATLNEWRARKRAASMRDAVAGKIGPLKVGDTVLRGTVETEEPHDVALAMQIYPIGFNQLKPNGQRAQAHEVVRRVDARTFYLRLEDGRAVRVEPDSQVFVETAPTSGIAGDDYRTSRRDEVRGGDQVYILGTLFEGNDPRVQSDAGYRGAPQRSLVMRAPRNGSMFVTNQTPTTRHLRREGFHGNWALLFGALAMVMHLGAFGSYWVLLATGTQVQATVLETHMGRGPLRSGLTNHVSARYENVSGHQVTVRDECAFPRENPEALADGARVPFVVSTYSAQIAQIGTNPSVSLVRIIAALLGLFAAAGAYALSTRASRPWFERIKIVAQDRAS
ncbi:MAG: hypothetical protein Q8Q09_18370 [Deltaproteobacteria bacterium]|nr:hypothetical protein [Deltaproteobacteria bacterium]